MAELSLQKEVRKKAESGCVPGVISTKGSWKQPRGGPGRVKGSETGHHGNGVRHHNPEILVLKGRNIFKVKNFPMG